MSMIHYNIKNINLSCLCASKKCFEDDCLAKLARGNPGVNDRGQNFKGNFASITLWNLSRFRPDQDVKRQKKFYDAHIWLPKTMTVNSVVRKLFLILSKFIREINATTIGPIAITTTNVLRWKWTLGNMMLLWPRTISSQQALLTC